MGFERDLVVDRMAPKHIVELGSGNGANVAGSCNCICLLKDL